MKYTNDFYTESVTRTQGSGYNAVAYWAVSITIWQITNKELQPPAPIKVLNTFINFKLKEKEIIIFILKNISRWA